MENIRSPITNQGQTAQQGIGTAISSNEHPSDFFTTIGRFFTEALNSIKNFLPNCFTDFYRRSLSDQDLKNIHSDFATKLETVTNLGTASSPNNTHQYNAIKGDAMMRRNLISLLDKAKIIVGKCEYGSVSKIESVISFLSEKTIDDLDVVDNAYVSYLLEATLSDLKTARDIKTEALRRSQLTEGDSKNSVRQFASLQRYNNVIEVIKILKDKAGKSMQRLAKDEIITALNNKYSPQFKVGYSRTITLNGSLGISTGAPINIEGVCALEAKASVDRAVTVQWMLDDEGYITIIKTKATSGTAALTADFGLAKASVMLNGDKTIGDFREVKTSQEFVTYLLPDFIRDSEHRNDPDIARYLSRSGILAHALSDKKISQDVALWAVTREEVIDIDLFEAECDLLNEHHTMLLSLFASSTTLDIEPDLSIDKANQLSSKEKILQKLSIIEDLQKEIIALEKQPYSQETAKEIELLEKLFLSEKKMLRQLDIFVDVDDVKTDKSEKTVTSKPVNVTNVNPAEAEIEAYSWKIEAEAGVGLDVLGLENVISAGIAGSYSKRNRAVKDIKTTSPCLMISNKKTDEEKEKIEALILSNKTKTDKEKELLIELALHESVMSDEKKVQLKDKLRYQFNLFSTTLFEHWIKETDQLSLTDVGRHVQEMSRNKHVRDSQFKDYLQEKGLNEDLINLRQEPNPSLNREGPLTNTEKSKQLAHGDARWKLLKENDLIKTSRSIDFKNEKDLFERLKRDFKFYTNLQIRIAAQKFEGIESLQDQQTLKNFEKRYGAFTKEQLLHRMIVANAYFMSNVKGKDDEAILLKADMLEFEQAVLSAPFDFDKKYMQEHAYYQESMDFEVSEDIYAGELGFNVVVDGVTLKFEYITRTRTHTNQLRDGVYHDINFSVSGVITNLSELMTAVAKSITLAKGLPEAVAKKIMEDMKAVLTGIEPTAAYSLEKAYLLRYFKPSAFGGNLPEKLLFYRESLDELVQIGIKGSIPTGFPVNLTFGLGYTDASTDSELEEFSSETFMYAFMFGLHEYAVTSNDELSSFDISTNENWKEIKLQQSSFFEQCFLNYALELGTTTTEDASSLSQEIAAIKAEMDGNDNLTQLQKENFAKAVKAFETAVLDFQTAVQGDQYTHTEFDEAINRFEKLMHAYSPHWLDQRANSSHYKNGYLPELEIPRDSCALRLEQARLQQTLFGEGKFNYESNVALPTFMSSDFTADQMHYYGG